MNSAPRPDLHSLAQSAQSDEALRAGHRATKLTMGRRTRWSTRLTVVALAVALSGALVVGGVGGMVLDQLAPSRIEKRARLDFERVLQQARDAVEAHRRAEGSLPAVLPSGSLAGLVRYEQKPPGYRLSISGANITVWLDSDGQSDFIQHRP